MQVVTIEEGYGNLNRWSKESGEMARYEDCPAVEVETIVHASPAVVWRFVTDIGVPARFSPEFKGAHWLDGATGPSKGARFVGRNEHPEAGAWKTVCTIVDYEPERRFGYVVEDPERPAATWRFVVEPLDSGGVRLRQWARIGPGPSLLNIVIDADPADEQEIVDGRMAELRENMTLTVHGIKSLAEQAAGA